LAVFAFIVFFSVVETIGAMRHAKGLLVMKWIFGALVIAIAMGWVATATIPAAAVSIDQASLKFLPADTQGIASIDVAGLRNVSLLKSVFDLYQPTIEGKLPEFLTVTGFVPQRDVDHVTLGKIGAQDTVAIIQARYDRVKAEQSMTDKGVQPETYLGHNIFPLDVQKGPNYRTGEVTFLDGLIVLGQGDVVKKSLDQMQIPGSAPLRSDLMAAIQTIDAGSQVWAVGDFSIGDLSAAGIRGPAPVMDMFKSLQSGTYQMHVDSGVHARATANFADTDSAQNLRDLANGALAVAKLQVAKQQPDMMHVLDGIQVSTSGPMLVVQIDEPGDLLKKLRGGLNQLKGQIR
jgi:hypothetical protein